MTTEVNALIERFDHLRNSGVCSPTTRGLLDDAQALLAALSSLPVDEVREALDLDTLEAQARAQVVAIDQMYEVGIGVGGMTEPNFAAFRSWQDATEGYDHADTVLRLIDRIRFEVRLRGTITEPTEVTREALLAVRDEIVRNEGRADAACLATLEAIAAGVFPSGTVTDADADADADADEKDRLIAEYHHRAVRAEMTAQEALVRAEALANWRGTVTVPTRPQSEGGVWGSYVAYLAALEAVTDVDALAKAWDAGVRTAGGYGHEDTWTHDMTPYSENPFRGEARS